MTSFRERLWNADQGRYAGFAPDIAVESPIELTSVVIYDNIWEREQMAEARRTRPISWLKAARQDFEKFPEKAKAICLAALTIAAEGGKADIVKRWHGFGSGVLEIALSYKGDALRVVHAVKIGQDVWVIHAFKKKSTIGVKTPQIEIDLVRERLRRLKEILK